MSRQRVAPQTWQGSIERMLCAWESWSCSPTFSSDFMNCGLCTVTSELTTISSSFGLLFGVETFIVLDAGLLSLCSPALCRCCRLSPTTETARLGRRTWIRSEMHTIRVSPRGWDDSPVNSNYFNLTNIIHKSLTGLPANARYQLGVS